VELFPRDAILYLEGTSMEKDVQDFLEARKVRGIIPLAKEGRGGARCFHMRLDPDDVSGLAALVERCAWVELCDHLHVYRGNTLLLEGYDITTHAAKLSGELSESRVKAFCKALRYDYRKSRASMGVPSGAPSAWRENLESLLWAVALALLIRTFIMAPFKIPSGSMRPTLIEGDRILVNKFLYRFRPPQRGEIIVFRFPDDPKRPFIKRLAGVGGDTVELRDGQLVVNGTPTEAGPLADIPYQNQGIYGQGGHVVQVPEGSFYVLGDNPGSSHDSRFWGFVPKRLLIGRAMCIFWPITRWRILR